jgi:hypothetical protein
MGSEWGIQEKWGNFLVYRGVTLDRCLPSTRIGLNSQVAYWLRRPNDHSGMISTTAIS